jgi:hypothetical protein
MARSIAPRLSASSPSSCTSHGNRKTEDKSGKGRVGTGCDKRRWNPWNIEWVSLEHRVGSTCLRQDDCVHNPLIAFRRKSDYSYIHTYIYIHIYIYIVYIYIIY